MDSLPTMQSDGDIGLRIVTDYRGPTAGIGVIGGSGLYAFLDDAVDVEVPTPYGPTSGPLTVGSVAGRAVAFVPRHGRGHVHAPHGVPYRANLWALRSMGVRQVFAPSAVGSLRPELGPGRLVVPDQVVDRTWGREHTFNDAGSSGEFVPGVAHVGFADPYCPRGRAAVLAAAADATDGGTLVVINGPRFSSRAESQWHAAQGWSVVGMTGMPEAGLARELALCYTTIALVTDHDAGVEGISAVTHDEVLRVFAANLDRVRGVLAEVIASVDDERTCPCPHVLDGLLVPYAIP